MPRKSSDEVSNLASLARLETLKSKLVNPSSLTLAEFHEALTLCEDLDLATGTLSVWTLFKSELERIQQSAIAHKRVIKAAQL